MNKKKYAGLLTEYLPGVIDTDREYRRIESVFNRLMTREDLSPEEDRIFDLLAKLMEDYETRRGLRLEKAPPAEILKHFISDRGIRQKDLIPVFKSESVVSEVVSGKRSISPEYARGLGDFFGVPPHLFLNL